MLQSLHSSYFCSGTSHKKSRTFQYNLPIHRHHPHENGYLHFLPTFILHSPLLLLLIKTSGTILPPECCPNCTASPFVFAIRVFPIPTTSCCSSANQCKISCTEFSVPETQASSDALLLVSSSTCILNSCMPHSNALTQWAAADGPPLYVQSSKHSSNTHVSL